ncbi:MAG TPA: hypothetical protein VF581_07620 [Flavobacterium sp.]|jgi:hypothetical protein
MRTIILLLFTGLLISLSSCREDFEFKESVGGLEFSRDTVYLDTVFTDIGSSTYTLKVYNRSDEDISIPTVQLGRGLDSKYRMTVDGMQGNNGKVFNNVEMLANDSLYIFIETTANIADANPDDFLYTDQIQFGAGTQTQTVELVTLIQDAVFLYPQRNDQGVYETIQVGVNASGEPVNARGFFLEGDAEFTWTKEKPYVIYGYAGIPTGETLTVEAGARIHFHESSGIFAANGASLKVNGTIEEQVIFEGDRLEPGFSNVPGQWGTIWLSAGSIGNEFHNATIKNAIYGLYVQQSDLLLENVQVYDSSNFGILAETATITGKNVVINTAGQASLACTLGGNYEFKHSTFNNDWPSSQQAAVYIDNFFTVGDVEQPFTLVRADFRNCIIYGSNQTELQINISEDESFWNTPNFSKCLIKFNNTNPQFYIQNPQYAFINDEVQILKSENPDFFDPNNNDLRISLDSPAIGFGDMTVTSEVPFDITGAPRTSPDLGAYVATALED